MGFLRALFGPSKEEIWSQIARDIGGQYIDGGFWGTDALRYRHAEWEILLDTYTQSNGETQTTYTRMRAPFVNRDGLYFKIYREGFFSPVGKFFGMQDIQIGEPFFDEQFVIQGNFDHTIRHLLADVELKQLIMRQPRIHLEIRNDEGWFGTRFPDDVDLLYFSCTGVIKQTDQLRSLFDLFCCTLTQLVAIDSAYQDDPNVRLS